MLVDDHGQLAARAPHVGEQPPQQCRLGDRQRGLEQGAHLRPRACLGRNPQHVLGRHDALDVVQPLVGHGEAGVAGVNGQPPQVVAGRVHMQPHHLRAGDHRVAGAQLTKLECALQQRRFGLVQRPLARGLGDDVLELLGRHAALELVDRFDADHPQQTVGGAVEQPDDRPREAHVQLGAAREHQRAALGLRDREVFGTELAEHHLRARGDDEAGADRDGACDGVRQPHQLEQRRERGPEGRLGDEADDQRGDRDAQLRARQHERQPPGHRDGAGGTRVTLLGDLFEPFSPDGDERELGRDEVAVGEDQGDDGGQPESDVHLRPRPWTVALRDHAAERLGLRSVHLSRRCCARRSEAARGTACAFPAVPGGRRGRAGCG